MLRISSAGESHGKCIVGILEGMVRGVDIDASYIEKQLTRRRAGFGRSPRMRKEKDFPLILSGVRKKKTTGMPIAIMIKNKFDTLEVLPPINCPRPGHADLAGMMKYGLKDSRDILERSSARETAIRVGLTSICKKMLEEFNVRSFFHVISIGGEKASTGRLSLEKISKAAAASELSCADKKAQDRMKAAIKACFKSGDTLGGIFELVISGVTPGIGGFSSWEKRLDARIAYALMSIPSVKGVEFGAGFSASSVSGKNFHDPIDYCKSIGFSRRTNNAGGIEGGMSNGQPIRIKVFVKPISTLEKGIDSVNVLNKKAAKAHKERHDITVVPACGVIAENLASFVIADAFLEKFGGDCLKETSRNYANYIKQLKSF